MTPTCAEKGKQACLTSDVNGRKDRFVRNIKQGRSNVDQDDKVGITTTTHAGRGMQWPIGDHETEQLNAAGDINPISCEPTTGFNGHAGEVLSAPKVFAIYWGRDYGTPAVGLNNTARNFDSFLATVLNSTYMDMLAQYGVGRGTFAGSTWVDHDPGTSQTFTYSGMSELLTNWLNAGLSPIVPAPNEVQLLFVIFASREVTLTDDNGNTGFCGYHSSGFFKIFPWPWTKKNLFFAVIGANGTTDIVAHELAEAATDRSGNGWFSDSTSPCSSMFDHPEIGDVCSACGAPTLRIDGFDVASYWLVDAGRCLQQSDLTPAPPAMGIVPDVCGADPPRTGLSPARARAAITGAGFGFSETFDPTGGRRFAPYAEDQFPAGGTKAPLRTAVEVSIAVWHPGPTP